MEIRNSRVLTIFDKDAKITQLDEKSQIIAYVIEFVEFQLLNRIACVCVTFGIIWQWGVGAISCYLIQSMS